MAAVDPHGALLVRAAVPGERSQLPGRVRSVRRPHPVPGLVTRRNAGLFVVAADPGRAASSRLLARPASAVTGRTAPTSAGFTP